MNNNLKSMILPRSFYETDTLSVAHKLIGQILVRVTPEGVTKGRIVETEAYLGEIDPAAHSYRGRTQRVRVMYGEKGLAYVYMIYGMYHCLNITTGAAGKPEVVLIRALEPLEGIELMKARRNTDKLKNLCSGPGKLCRAMAIDMAQYGVDLCTDGGLYLEQGEPADFSASPRINIDYAGEAALWPYRFTMRDNSFISR
jgi:DNA-3-methyladenine glycosylase